ncbi:bis(5'-nucleosyl)-tetraphosphatase (symmetrical) YqeK [Tissierella sp. MB52-C2]|uniref:bis(5'-nucleosyl)-tetraphosphatase (symmetrical) YqeK n=1 Tax=Tissierella sp. MB52-C2 TaxID=3070999 RepID=UPI00280C3AEE|nr:bis(5'-nucleosyl)-tetraphosphatase (symmetrical) YqeK [Tissierella sp. MB52-C2]WMM23805.1 bis(5'-nucleosyl)-tetraphosphatase (symmetrical) YqeK [Tissierella sp. MB52-C2]
MNIILYLRIGERVIENRIEKGACMHPTLMELKEQLEITGNIVEDGINLLYKYEKHIVAEHSKNVAVEAERLADLLGENCTSARIAGALHDISAIIPDHKKIEIAESLDIDILDEEREFPSIIHQKISREIANILFGITNEEILSAICCHTTLKSNPTRLEMILFIADKLKWDQKGIPPYLDNVKNGLEKSLEHGVFIFIKYLYENKSNLKVLHPWLIEAYNFFSELIGA